MAGRTTPFNSDGGGVFRFVYSNFDGNEVLNSPQSNWQLRDFEDSAREAKDRPWVGSDLAFDEITK
jgi:hypothetical protein